MRDLGGVLPRAAAPDRGVAAAGRRWLIRQKTYAAQRRVPRDKLPLVLSLSSGSLLSSVRSLSGEAQHFAGAAGAASTMCHWHRCWFR